VQHSVRIGTVSEAPLPPADVVDASPTGILVAFAEPVGLLTGQRLCLSFPLPDGALHLMASVVRVERGDDFRTYVGVALQARADGTTEFGSDLDPDVERWLAWLAARDGSAATERRRVSRVHETSEPSSAAAPDPDDPDAAGDQLAELAARLDGADRWSPRPVRGSERATPRVIVNTR
jgi:hypothetical protein